MYTPTGSPSNSSLSASRSPSSSERPASSAERSISGSSSSYFSSSTGSAVHGWTGTTTSSSIGGGAAIAGAAWIAGAGWIAGAAWIAGAVWIASAAWIAGAAWIARIAAAGASTTDCSSSRSSSSCARALRPLPGDAEILFAEDGWVAALGFGGLVPASCASARACRGPPSASCLLAENRDGQRPDVRRRGDHAQRRRQRGIVLTGDSSAGTRTRSVRGCRSRRARLPWCPRAAARRPPGGAGSPSGARPVWRSGSMARTIGIQGSQHEQQEDGRHEREDQAAVHVRKSGSRAACTITLGEIAQLITDGRGLFAAGMRHHPQRHLGRAPRSSNAVSVSSEDYDGADRHQHFAIGASHNSGYRKYRSACRRSGIRRKTFSIVVSHSRCTPVLTKTVAMLRMCCPMLFGSS